jgi:hypothetical protein
VPADRDGKTDIIDGVEERFARALYRVFLNREPDPVGLDSALRQLRMGYSFEDVMRWCLRSTEFAEKLPNFIEEYVAAGKHRAQTSRTAEAKGVSTKKSVTASPVDGCVAKPASHPIRSTPVIRYAASLGSHCYASWLLSQMQLRKYALPFDYIFSDLGMVAHCISDDFKSFLDISQYERIDDAGRCAHEFYSKQFNRSVIYNHHDVTQEKDHLHFVRAAERFNRLLASNGAKLFVCVSEEPRVTDAKETLKNPAVGIGIG